MSWRALGGRVETCVLTFVVENEPKHKKSIKMRLEHILVVITVFEDICPVHMEKSFQTNSEPFFS